MADPSRRQQEPLRRIRIIGIGDDGLDGLPSAARRTIEQADILAGDERTLALVPQLGTQRIVLAGDLDQAVRRLGAQQGKRIVLLASGDPLFYGLARFFCEKLGKEQFVIEPHVSSMQLAFARVMESWEEAYLTNLANHPLDEVIERIRTAEKVGLFTSDLCTPSHVARALIDRGIGYFSAYVCENLGSPDERVTQGSLAEMTQLHFSPLNVMILVRRPHVPDQPRDAAGVRLFGNPDEVFLQSKPKHGLLTPAEVRAVALAEMNLQPASIVWDVGAGSGSVSIEAAQIASQGTAYAIEMDTEDYQLIRENAQRLGVANVSAVLGKAPEAWSELPDPDSVFIEGSGREVSRIVELAFDRLRPGGRLVANVGNVENLADVHRTMSRKASRVEVWMINVARGTHQLERMRFDALNPTFLLAIGKQRTASAPPR